MYSNFKEQAIDYVKQAVREDNAGNYARAFPLYMNALEYFKTHLKYERDPKMREAITEKFEEYLRRAEEIRTVLDGGGGAWPGVDAAVAARPEAKSKDGENKDGEDAEQAKFFTAQMSSNPDQKLVTHNGGCHCKRVRWKVEAPASLVAWKCNCSICSMKGNTHFIVPIKHFTLISGESNITTYTFGTHIAKHTFCNVCGITSFYTPRSNPDGVGVTLACLDPGTLTHVEIRSADGANWEDFYSKSGISAFSKLES